MPSISRRTILRALPLAIAACCGSAQAVTVNPDGSGQALIYPYYSVNQGNQTVLSMVNLSDRAKALKVRFREAQNGRATLEFALYLDAYDSWSASVFSLDSTGAANLVTADASCTVPNIVSNASLPQLPGGGARYVPFRNFAYTGSFDDTGANDLSRTREGFLEIIEMGTLTPASASAQSAALGANGSPANCAALNQAWTTGGYWSNNANQDISAPTGGLSGFVGVVDIADGTLYGARATALDSFRTSSLHTAPGGGGTTLGDAQDDDAGGARATTLVGNRLLVSRFPSGRGVDAVSAVLAAERLVGEYSTSSALGARTDFVVTFPTKNFYADSGSISAAIPPFTQLFPRTGAQVCESAAISVLDRQGQGAARSCATAITDPGACGFTAIPLCSQVEVLSFGTGSPLASALAESVGTLPASAEGYAVLDLGNQGTQTHLGRPSIEGFSYAGLPAIGFAATQYVNGQLAGNVLANYASFEPLRAERRCDANGTAGSCRNE